MPPATKTATQRVGGTTDGRGSVEGVTDFGFREDDQGPDAGGQPETAAAARAREQRQHGGDDAHGVAAEIHHRDGAVETKRGDQQADDVRRSL